MKNKKRLIAIAMSAVLLLAGAAFTYAYFTDSKEQTNVFTMGNVEITLDEPLFTEKYPESKIGNVQPNQNVVKDPTITLATTSNDAYVRAMITYTGDITDVQKAELEAGINFENGWTKGTDGYYYYNTALTQANNEVLVFGSIDIPELWGDEISGKTFNVVVKAEAIQADNFTPVTDNGDITGWLTKDGNPITANSYN